jgi:hypothetical protein
VLKYVIPAIWLPLAGLALVAAVRHPEWLIDSGVKFATPPSIAVRIAIAVWAIASCVGAWTRMPLKRVRVDADALLISNYIREWRIPFALIESVSQNRWLNAHEIAIRLRADVGCGLTVTFEPPRRRGFKFGTENAQVRELRELAGLVAAEKASVA